MSQTVSEADRLEALAAHRDEQQRTARAKIARLLKAYPRDAPPEFILFGYGGVKVTLGEMKDAFGLD